MNADRWALIKPLFQGALDMPDDVRAAWLRDAAGGDPELITEVEQLLRIHANADDFLERPIELAPEDLTGITEDLPPGHRIGEYEIVGTLGRGGMGTVYLARDLRLDRRVAVKVLSPGLIVEQREQRLEREARTTARIFHPSVAALLDIGEADGRRYIVSEYVPGSSLRHILQQGQIEATRARAIAADITRGVNAAHQAGTVHRDLKPENVMVTEGGNAKIVDFGIARLMSDNVSITVPGAIIGTPAYMAPELLLDGRGTPGSDIYAIGVILEEMLTGRHPLAAPQDDRLPGADAFTRHLHAVADRARQPDRHRRFQTASELLAALDAVTGAEPATVRSADDRHGGRARRFWWEFHQGAAAVSYAAMLVPAWLAKAQIGGREGRSFFIATAVAALVASMLRLHLWFMSRQHAGELAWARRRSVPFIRLADIFLVVSLVIGAALVAARSVLDVVLLVLAVGVAIASAFIEPSTARAAGLDNRGGRV